MLYAGVLANRSLPNWLITFLLLVVLLWQTWVSLMKTLAMLRKQRQARRAQRAQQQQQQTQQAQQRRMQACQELARLPVGGPAAPEEGDGDGASSGASSPREGAGGSPLLGGSPRVLSRRASFAERLSRTSWGSFAEIPSLEASADWGCEGQEAGGSARRVHSAHSMHSTVASHPRADGGGAPPVPRSSSLPAGRGPEAGAAKRPVGLGGAAGGSTHSILPTIPSVGARLDALESAPPHQGQAGRWVIPAGSPASRKISGDTSRSDGSTGCSSTGSAAGKPPLLRAVAHSMRQAARELRPPTLDGPTLRRLAAVAGCWVPFVGFQGARAELAKSNGTACTPGYEALLALEFVFLLSLAAAYTGFVVWTRRRQQRQRVGASMAAAGGGQTGAAGSLPPPVGRSGAGAAPKAGAAGGSGAAAAVVAVAAGPAGGGASSDDDCAGGSCWSLRKLLVVQLITAVGGTLATALGLGGGELVLSAIPEKGTQRSVAGGPMPACLPDACCTRARCSARPGRSVRSPPASTPAFETCTYAPLLSVAAGLVMGPLLLALDVHPLVASATSSFMVLLTVGSATLTYSLQVGDNGGGVWGGGGRGEGVRGGARCAAASWSALWGS